MVAGKSEDRAAALSHRELEVAELVAQGWTNREIAERLFISPRTVESHLDHVKSKLGLSRRPHIVAWALRQHPAGERATWRPQRPALGGGHQQHC
jgi:DNA-binding CsgD family transcriptional regulator